jgi:hypothetical protein
MKKTSRTALSCAPFRAATLIISMLVSSMSLSAQFCASKSNAPWELWIAKVQLNTLNNASEKYKDYNTLGYSDFTNITTTITKGMTYELTTTAGVSWSGIVPNAHCRTWIDWNRNNVFEDAELVAQNNAVNPFAITVRVPTTAVLGATRMRISVKSGSFPTPCATFESGEVEDYSITIAEPMATVISDLAVVNVVAPTRLAYNRVDSMSFDIKNIGGLTSAYGYVNVYLSSDNSELNPPIFIGYFSFDSIAPNASRTYKNNVYIPNTWSSETANIVVFVKAYDNETSLANNTSTSRASVTLPPLSCGHQISPNNTVLCFDNANPNAVKITVVEGDAIVQKTVDKNGNLLNSSVVDSQIKDSVLVFNNQVIKKFPNGSIVYSKTIPPSVLSRFPKIELALEMSDGTFVLAGLQKYIAPQGNIPYNRDSLVLITTDAQLNFQESSVVFANGGPYVPPYNGVLRLIGIPNTNQFIVMFYIGRSESVDQSMLNLAKYKKNNTQLRAINGYANGSYLIGKPILTTACGNNLFFKNGVAIGGGSKGGTDGGVYTTVLSLDSMRPLTLKSIISGSSLLGSSKSYAYVFNPTLQENGKTISGSFSYNTSNGAQLPPDLVIFFYDNFGEISFRKTIPFLPYDHIIRTGDSTCLIVINRNDQSFAYNPDCNNTPLILPDLTIKNLTISNLSVPQRQILYYKFDAKNIGTGSATSPFTIKSYLSYDRNLDVQDYQNGVISTANYAVGTDISQIQGAMTVGPFVFPGDYFLILKIDADDQITEENEYNNTISIPVKITQDATCRYEDSLELVKLYVAANGANWSTKWQLNTPINTWFGVQLNQKGCVTGLVLPNNNLAGTLPNVNFVYLEYLKLNDNALRGSIPNFNCPRLSNLYLNNCQFTGSIPNFSCPILHDIVLNNNQLSGTIPNFNYYFLYRLDLGRNRLTGTLPTFDFIYLREIDLSRNQLTGTLPTINCQYLEKLWLQDNQLSGTIPNFVLPSLKDFALSSNQLTGNIPKFNTQSLEFLVLNNNFLSGVFPNFNFPNLKYFNVENNQLSGELPNFNFPKLTYLVARNNQLSGVIPNFDYPNLDFLDLGKNQFSGTIPNFNLPQLRSLWLSFNQLSGALPSLNLPFLQTLWLQNNQISGCIPASFRSFCGKDVNISNNPNLSTQDFTAFCTNNIGACVTVNNGNDIGLSLLSTPSVYRQYSTQNVQILLQNLGNRVFSNMKIDFPFPAKTVSCGVVVPSIGTWQEWCSGGTQCFTWTIPTLAANTTATLDVPLYVLDAVAPIIITTHILSATPATGVISVSTSIRPAGSPPMPQPLIPSKPTVSTPIFLQRLNPTIAEHFIVVELESGVNQSIDFQIVNALGTVVLTRKLNIEQGNNKLNFNVEKLPKGMYFIQTSLGNGDNVPMKFVKM